MDGRNYNRFRVVVAFAVYDYDVCRVNRSSGYGNDDETNKNEKTTSRETINEPSKTKTPPAHTRAHPSCGNRVPFAPLKMYVELMARTETDGP